MRKTLIDSPWNRGRIQLISQSPLLEVSLLLESSPSRSEVQAPVDLRGRHLNNSMNTINESEPEQYSTLHYITSKKIHNGHRSN